MKRLINKLYHLSEDDLNNKLITPRVPYNKLTKTGFENCSIARICFAPNVENCLIAIGDDLQDKIFNVYEPMNYNNLQIISNDEIVKNNYVADAFLTREVWVTNPVIMKYLYKIKVLNAVDKPFKVQYDDEICSEYSWNYEIIK